MNRRAFLSRLSAGIVGACVAAKIPTGLPPSAITTRAMHYRGVPLRYDPNMPSDRVYFLNTQYFVAYKSATDRLHVWDQP